MYSLVSGLPAAPSSDGEEERGGGLAAARVWVAARVARAGARNRSHKSNLKF